MTQDHTASSSPTQATPTQATPTQATPTQPPPWIYLLAILIVIPVGLSTRSYRTYWPLWIATYGGDTLWALNLYLLFRLLRPSARLLHTGLLCLAVCFLVEVSQLWHTPWLDHLRHTRLGALALGKGFLWSDLLCYTLGCFLGLSFDALLRRYPPIQLTFHSTLHADADTIWTHATSMQGVNAELKPWLAMHVPPGLDLSPRPIAPPGQALFPSWLLLFGFLPFDKHYLYLHELKHLHFEERSHSWLQQQWQHIRTISPINPHTCTLQDTLTVQPRLNFITPLTSWIVTRLFQHRHQHLRTHFPPTTNGHDDSLLPPAAGSGGVGVPNHPRPPR